MNLKREKILRIKFIDVFLSVYIKRVAASGKFCEEKEWGASHLFWLKVYEKIKEGCVIQKGIDTKTERGTYPA